MIYADRVESDWPIRVQLPTGTRVPLHCTASGKLYLSRLSPAKRKRIISRLSLDRFTTATLVDAEELEEELVKIREAGYGWDNQEFIDGLVAVAVPILDTENRFFGGLAVHGPLPRFSMQHGIDCLPAMRNAAHSIATMTAETWRNGS